MVTAYCDSKRTVFSTGSASFLLTPAAAARYIMPGRLFAASILKDEGAATTISWHGSVSVKTIPSLSPTLDSSSAGRRPRQLSFRLEPGIKRLHQLGDF